MSYDEQEVTHPGRLPGNDKSAETENLDEVTLVDAQPEHLSDDLVPAIGSDDATPVGIDVDLLFESIRVPER